METIIGIPTYFGNRLVVNCIESILKNITFPNIQIYKNDVGFLQASNKLMLDNSCDIILLNDDTLVLTDIVKEMSDLAYSDPKIGIVGAKSLDPNGMIINYGIYIAPDGNSAHRYYGQRDADIDTIEKQQAVEGSCIFIKREVIDKVGVFDENYGFGYREEVDLCFRAREAGYKVVSCPTAKYIHFTSQTHSHIGISNTTHDYFMSKWGQKLQLGKV